MSAWGFAKLEKKIEDLDTMLLPYQKKKRMTKKKIGGETEKHKRDDT